MTKIKFGKCPCTVIMMSDKKTIHSHFCDAHGGPDKNHFTVNSEDLNGKCDEEPDDFSCSCKKRVYVRESKKLEKMLTQEIKPLTETGVKIIKRFISMYPGTEVVWKLHKKDWPIEMEAPTALEFPCEKVVSENGLERTEVEYTRRLVFRDWQHLIFHIKHGIRPYKTHYDTSKAKWVPTETMTLTSEDVL